MITATRLEFVKTDGEGVKWWRAVLTATEEPTSLEISGADADNVNDELGFAAGSVLIAPASNYIALEDGVFTLKSSGGGGGGGQPGIKSISVYSLSDGAWVDVTSYCTFSPEPPITDLIPFDTGGYTPVQIVMAGAPDDNYRAMVFPMDGCSLSTESESYDVDLPVELDFTIAGGTAALDEIAVFSGPIESGTSPVSLVHITVTTDTPK